MHIVREQKLLGRRPEIPIRDQAVALLEALDGAHRIFAILAVWGRREVSEIVKPLLQRENFAAFLANIEGVGVDILGIQRLTRFLPDCAVDGQGIALLELLDGGGRRRVKDAGGFLQVSEFDKTRLQIGDIVTFCAFRNGIRLCLVRKK